MKKPDKYDRYVTYDGLRLNPEIIELKKKRYALDSEIKSIIDQMNLIRDKCEHEYEFSCRGMYEDSYICAKCGDITEN